MRSAPRGPASASERLAARMRGPGDALDSLSRARMERNLVDAWRARSAAQVARRSPRRRSGSRAAWAMSVAVSAAAGVALGFYAWRSHEPPAPAHGLVAHFELVIDDGAVQSGYLAEGQVLESGKHGHIEVGIGQSRLDIAPDSRVRFDRLAQDELRVSLVTGRIEVAFRPARKGRERMSVETRAASVVVVGTRFTVSASSQGDTDVQVTEGVVQVVPRAGGETRLLRAGERVALSADAPADRAQALRETIERRLSDDPAPELAPAPENEPTGDAAPSARGVKRAAGDAAQLSEAKLEAARELLLQAKHAAARERLYGVTRSAPSSSARVEAFVLIAESYTAQGQIPRAADAYREAVAAAPRHPAAHNALFALARLLERYTDDRGAAGVAYREYLSKAPSGALAHQAREALCRLGDAAACE